MKRISFSAFSIICFILLLCPIVAVASANVMADGAPGYLIYTWPAISALLVFFIAYLFVMTEEFIHLRKSKPVILASGIIWCLVGIAFVNAGKPIELVTTSFRHVLLEFSELFIFLLVAMTYVNALEKRNVFAALRGWLISKNFSFRQIFWITGVFAFLLSPIADNLTTALVMCAVVMAAGAGHPKFIAIACINIVVAANAGGAFSPFGDITTLMVWQKGILSFFEFFYLFVPAVINFLVPAVFMSFAVPKKHPKDIKQDSSLKTGAIPIILLFLLTLTITVLGHQFLHLPPVFGMMTGFSLLGIYTFLLRSKTQEGNKKDIDIFHLLSLAEWDTLFFFYGVLLCVGGLASFGYLAVASEVMYSEIGATGANVIVGILSALVDNIPVMYAVLTILPSMDMGQWLLVTLTAGVGGSLLSVGSAAGVALMGQARGVYTFFAHLKWSWAVALGYIASIYAHFAFNKHLFDGIVMGVG